MPAHQERTSGPREASLSLLLACPPLPPTSPQAVTDLPSVTGQLICKYSSHQFWAQLANTYLLFGGWAFYGAFKIHNSQTARETDIHRGKAVWGHLLGVSPPLQPGLQDGPTSLCLVGSDSHLLSWLALGDWGPLAGTGTPPTPVSSGTSPVGSGTPGRLGPSPFSRLHHSPALRTPPPPSSPGTPLLGLSAAPAGCFLLLPGSVLPIAQQPDTSRSAAERGFIQEAAEHRGKTHLKPASREARGWSVLGMKNQEEGWSRLVG